MAAAFAFVGHVVGAAIAGAGAAAAGFSTAAVIGATVLKAGILMGASALLKPKQSKPQVASKELATGTQVDFKADMNAGVPLALGRTATGGNIIHVTTNGQENTNNTIVYIIVLSAGPIQAFEKFYINDNEMWLGLDGNPEAVGWGQYAYHMAVRYLQGWQPSAYVPLPGMSEGSWDGSKILSGLAGVMWMNIWDEKSYPNGIPKPLWIIRGPTVYDPRRDSTFPGGSGSQRWYSEATWDFFGNENPFLQALTWIIGRRQNGRLVHGAGIPIDGIDVDAFVEGANVCDYNGWKIGGIVSSADRKWDVLRAMLQAGGGEPVKMSGRISCMVNSPKVALATIYEKDVKGKTTITGSKSRRDRFNRVVPRFRSEGHGWEYVSSGAEEVQDYIVQDGQIRSKEIEYTLVQNPWQAAQLARYDIENSREKEPIEVPLGLEWADYKVGDALAIQGAEFGLEHSYPTGAIVIKRQVDLQKAQVTLTLRTEWVEKHARALQAIPKAPPVNNLPKSDFSYVRPPNPWAYAIQGASVTSANGLAMPILVFYGGSDNPVAVSTIIRYRIVGTETWAVTETRAGEFFNDRIHYEIGNVPEGAVFEVQMCYRDRRGNMSDWVILTTSPVTAGYWAAPTVNNAFRLLPNVTNVTGYGWSNSYSFVPTNPAFGSDPAGGAGGPWTFQWTQLSGDYMYINNAEINWGVWWSAYMAPGTELHAIWRLTGTDVGNNVAVVDVGVSLYNVLV